MTERQIDLEEAIGAKVYSLPALPVTLDDIWAGRQKAVQLAGAAWDADAAAKAAAREVIGHIPVPDDDGALSRVVRRDDAGSGDRDKRVAAFRTDLDRSIWQRLIDITDLERLMDRKARDEFTKGLAENPPEPTPETVRATVRGLMLQRDEIFARGIANVFSCLDRRFRSHDGFKIGHRIVITNALSEWGGGWSHSGAIDTLRDVERTFYVLDAKQIPKRWDSGVYAAVNGLKAPFEVETEYFKVRGFKNRNVHIWFKRHDLLRRVNRLLADYYGEVIGEGSDVADTSEMGPGYHLTPAKNFGLFESPDAVVQKVFDRLGLGDDLTGLRVLEPSAGRGRIADEARRRGASVTCVEVQQELCMTLRRNGHSARNADFLTLKPADIGTFDVIAMNPPFDRGRDCDHVRHALKFLKPGGRLVSVMAARTEFADDKRTAAFRATIAKLRPVDRWWGAYRDLPGGSFRDAGTMVNTLTLAIINEADQAE